LGEISITVTGMSLFFASHTWVIPSFVPSSPFVVLVVSVAMVPL
jgi:hypothetical protein